MRCRARSQVSSCLFVACNRAYRYLRQRARHGKDTLTLFIRYSSITHAMILLRTAAAAALVVMSIAAPASVNAQDYPVRPIRIILPFSPGGGTDLLARLLSQRLHESL